MCEKTGGGGGGVCRCVGVCVGGVFCVRLFGRISVRGRIREKGGRKNSEGRGSVCVKSEVEE